MFVERYALTLVAAGNVVLLVSVAIILGPALVGHFGRDCVYIPVACFCRPHRWLGLSIAGLGGAASSF